MKNRKSICTHVFVTALLLALLLSLLIGIVVAPKPDKPGKPDTVETWDLTICIGTGYLKDSEDIVLYEPEYLFAEDVPCSGGLWDVPKTKKGVKPNPNNYVSAQVDLLACDGDNCGTYQLADVKGTDSAGDDVWLHDFPLGSYDVAYVSIRHLVWPCRGGEDFWTLVITWEVDFQAGEWYQLRAWTNKDYADEGTLSEEEGWLVPFNGSDALLYSDWTDAELDDVPDNYDRIGTVSFTITITRSPHVA